MPIDSATIWGKNVADAIAAIGVDDTAPVTQAQLEQVWAAIKGEDKTQLGKAAVAPGGFTAPSGGGAVAGVGGPVT